MVVPSTAAYVARNFSCRKHGAINLFMLYVLDGNCFGTMLIQETEKGNAPIMIPKLVKRQKNI